MPARKRSRTQAERLASLRWNIADAKEALINAVAMGDWRGVKKYTAQLEKLEVQLTKSSGKGQRRLTRENPILYLMSRKDALAQYEANDRQRQRGRRGIP